MENVSLNKPFRFQCIKKGSKPKVVNDHVYYMIKPNYTHAAVKQLKILQTWCSLAPEYFGMALKWMDVREAGKRENYVYFPVKYKAYTMGMLEPKQLF